MKHFHTKSKHSSFFEGWYFRHQNDRETLAVIPAFHADSAGNPSASVQIITQEESFYIPFSAKDFQMHPSAFALRIGNSFFCEGGILLDIRKKGVSLRGCLRYGDLTPIKSDIMGPFCYLPFMACRHGIISMNHSVTGNVTLNGKEHRFQNAAGYIEKDWGRSFPSKYLWTQCNRFQEADCSIFLSAAEIPLGPFRFTGCIASIYYKGKELRMATYLGAKVLRYDDQEAVVSQGNLIFSITRLSRNSFTLRAPQKGEMSRIIKENPSCRVRYLLTRNGHPLLDLTGEQAGFEYSQIKED